MFKMGDFVQTVGVKTARVGLPYRRFSQTWGWDPLLPVVPHQVAGHARGDAPIDQLRLQRRRPGGGRPGRGDGQERQRLDLEHGRTAAPGERPVLGTGLRAVSVVAVGIRLGRRGPGGRTSWPSLAMSRALLSMPPR